MKEITGIEYQEAADRYWWMCQAMPEKLKAKMPSFYKFISPAGYIYEDSVMLSITEERRLEIVNSRYARVLLAAYAVNRLEVV